MKMIGINMDRAWWSVLSLFFGCLCAGCMPTPSGSGAASHGVATRHVSPEDRRDAEFYSLQGLKACKEKQYGKAANLFRQSIKLQPGNAVFHNNLARTLYWMGQYDQALAAFGRAAELDPKDPRIRANLADLFRQKKDYRRAEEAYHQALEMANDSIEVQARVNYELGNMYLKQGRHKDAGYRLNRSIDLDPTYHRAYLARLIFYHLTRRYEQALTDMKHLEKNGYDVNPDLRRAVLVGVERVRERKRFRPGY